MKPLTMALPKGRLQDRMLDLLSEHQYDLDFGDRRLVAEDSGSRMSAFLVKNSDLPTYVAHGIAGLGVCGDDVLTESGTRLLRLRTLPFGATRMCLAGPADAVPPAEAIATSGRLEIATKFPRFARSYFNERGVPVDMVKLNGSVELAPLLGLAPYIVDLVETGNTLRANGLIVFEDLKSVEVHLVANPAYFKIHFRRIHEFIEAIGA